jgi:protein O-mannosyl-transferase
MKREWNGPTICGVCLIVVVTALVYWPSLRGGFLLDDDILLTNNRLIQSPHGLIGFWLSSDAPDYWPMTSTMLWLEWRLWKLNPIGYRLTNLLLHIVECYLIWVILRKLSIPGALAAALLFAVHPVNVESVAWIAQRKNMLAMLFFLLSILFYLNCRNRRAAGPGTPFDKTALAGRPIREWIWYFASIVAFVLAMLSKASIAILPLVLLLIVWWQDRRIERPTLFELAPFVFIAVALVAVNVWFQTHGASHPIRNANLAERLTGAGAAAWFYLSKALLPIDLIYVYPQWNIDLHLIRWWLPSIMALAGTATIWRCRNTRFGRPIWMAWLFFCVALLPVMGFTDVGFMKHSLVADHYQHVALIGVAAITAAAWDNWRTSGPNGKQASIVVLFAVLGGFGYLAFQQSKLYADTVGLYQATLRRNPDSVLMHINLGRALAESGQTEKAITQYRTALQLDPDQPEVHNNVANVLLSKGRLQDAIQHYSTALALDPDFALARVNLIDAYIKAGNLPRAMAECRAALNVDPHSTDAHIRLAKIYRKSGNLDEAIEEYKRALRGAPESAVAHNDFGNALKDSGRLEEAIANYYRAIELKADYPEAHNNLATLLLKSGQIDQALEHFEEALRLDPDLLEAHFNLGTALAQAGKPQAAINHLLEVLRLNPNDLQAAVNLANLYAVVNQIDEAISTAKQAKDLARRQGNVDLARQLENWLAALDSRKRNSGSELPGGNAGSR